ncbi:AraC family transcriptional regulator [Pseudoalteromonas rubra]|uniref:AraC family transcriptional regulator n=1 Tax=Pseudoalteromonas rubra TaxID=43658 RepID=A0A5S3WLT9_9GAMM|nr:helix-turn-helix domain-containing protein [Pseudoalteromonas rubra]TMP28554.1 AraC family transcriptional regulator [Pseudoalteromonas rubra]TMP30521.1 AraC family transcriptional regulator [Pseudoalteromonas rubra]
MTRKQVYFIADGFQALDLFGPLDTFMEANACVPNAYASKLLSIVAGPVRTAYGQQVNADFGLGDDIDLDDLIICGGSGMRTLTLGAQQLAALSTLADKAERVFSICTGAFVLAQLFPEQALTLTTHWRYCENLARQHQHCTVSADPLYIQDQHVWSSAGVLSGVDLALAIVREDHGNSIAAQVAKDLVVYLQRSGNQHQYSDALALQSGDSLKLSPLMDWLSTQLNQSVTVSRMAEFCNLSERQLTRLFKQHLNCTPSHYFKTLKLNHARDLLCEENISLQHVSGKLGFNSYDSFRRAFIRQFGVSPSHYTKGINR